MHTCGVATLVAVAAGARAAGARQAAGVFGHGILSLLLCRLIVPPLRLRLRLRRALAASRRGTAAGRTRPGLTGFTAVARVLIPLIPAVFPSAAATAVCSTADRAAPRTAAGAGLVTVAEAAVAATAAASWGAILL